MIKSTEYCDVLKEASIYNDTKDYKISIEEIYVKKEARNELRFSYSKENENGTLRLVIRPLDVTEDELFMLLKKGISDKVISLDLCIEMKDIIENNDLGIPSNNSFKETDYCKMYAVGSIEDDETRCSLEKIFIKEEERREVRFSYYKRNKKNNFQLIMRPLDVTESEFIEMFENAFRNGVFSKVFITALKTIL